MGVSFPLLHLFAGDNEFVATNNITAALEVELLRNLSLPVDPDNVSGSAPWFPCVDGRCGTMLRCAAACCGARAPGSAALCGLMGAAVGPPSLATSANPAVRCRPCLQACMGRWGGARADKLRVCMPSCRASDKCAQFDVLQNLDIPSSASKKSYFEGLVYSSWGMLALTA